MTHLAEFSRNFAARQLILRHLRAALLASIAKLIIGFLYLALAFIDGLEFFARWAPGRALLLFFCRRSARTSLWGVLRSHLHPPFQENVYIILSFKGERTAYASLAA
jgi:hypothetical protein